MTDSLLDKKIVPKLQLQVGHTYMNKRNDLRKIVSALEPAPGIQIFKDQEGLVYTSDGGCCEAQSYLFLMDLASEYFIPITGE